MKILVTGGCGRMGSELVGRLKNAGHHVTVVDDLSSGSLENLSDLDISVRPVLPGLFAHLEASGNLSKNDTVVITADFTDESVLRHIREERYSHIFHLADRSDHEYCSTLVTESTDSNLFKTLALADISSRSSVERFIFASCTQPTLSRNRGFFEIQKLSCEMFLDQIYSRSGLNSISLRLSRDNQKNVQALFDCAAETTAGAIIHSVGGVDAQ